MKRSEWLLSIDDISSAHSRHQTFFYLISAAYLISYSCCFDSVSQRATFWLQFGLAYTPRVEKKKKDSHNNVNSRVPVNWIYEFGILIIYIGSVNLINLHLPLGDESAPRALQNLVSDSVGVDHHKFIKLINSTMMSIERYWVSLSHSNTLIHIHTLVILLCTVFLQASSKKAFNSKC